MFAVILGDCFRFQYTWPFSASYCFFLSLYWHIFIARAIHGHRELRRDRNESTLHSLPLLRFVHIKSVFDRQSSLWSGKEKSRKGTVIKKKKKKESFVRVPEVRLETGCWWKRVPDALAFFFRRSIFELVFSLNNEATYSCLYTWMVSRTMTVFLHSLFPRVCRIKSTNRGEFRQILSRVLVTIMVPDRVPTRALLTARICCAYSLRARHARTIRYVLAGCMPTYMPLCRVRKDIAYSRRAV